MANNILRRAGPNCYRGVDLLLIKNDSGLVGKRGTIILNWLKTQRESQSFEL